jgi:hypothetical protein
MTKQEDKNFKEVDGFFSFLAYVLRYRLKEFLSLISLLLFGYILVSNIGCNQKDGLYWIPSVKIEVVK